MVRIYNNIKFARKQGFARKRKKRKEITGNCPPPQFRAEKRTAGGAKNDREGEKEKLCDPDEKNFHLSGDKNFPKRY